MPEIVEYRKLEKAQTIDTFFGGLGTSIYQKFKTLFPDGLPEWVGTNVFDGHEGEGVTKLNFTSVSDILEKESKAVIENQYTTIRIP
ncbi:MAG TPA: hypothetical protein VN368_03090, partial [Candidatus Methylomirabilis sp.]|nr:hypothetical protein [Candidatus Methylomirabilis sp.]